MGKASKKKKASKEKQPEASQQTSKAATAKGKAKAKVKINFAHIEEIFAPCQNDLNDVQIFYFDVIGGVRKYKTMMRLRRKRQRRLAPVLLGEDEIPVTPLPNPSTGPSHHILRLTNSHEQGYMVDLLIRDTDLYLIAFRRHRRLPGEEFLAGTWYAFSDRVKNKEIPEFIKNVESMKVESSHKGTKSFGGNIVFNEMFFSLAFFQDGTTDETALEMAVANAIVAFCEGSRFKSIYELMISRMGDSTTAGSDLKEETWKRIRAWGVLGRLWLSHRLDGKNNVDEQLPNYCAAFKFDPSTMGSIMSELLVVKFEINLLIDADELYNRQTKSTVKDIKDPKFKVKEEAEEQAEAAAVMAEEQAMAEL